MKRTAISTLCLLLVLAGGQARAMQLSADSPTGPPPPVRDGDQRVPARGVTEAIQQRAGPTVSNLGPTLISGIILRVDPGRAEMQVGAQPLTWDPRRLRVFDSVQRQAIDAAQLRRGQRIRLALDPAAAGQVVIIYVDAQP